MNCDGHVNSVIWNAVQTIQISIQRAEVTFSKFAFNQTKLMSEKKQAT